MGAYIISDGLDSLGQNLVAVGVFAVGSAFHVDDAGVVGVAAQGEGWRAFCGREVMGAVGDGEARQVPDVLGREAIVVHPPVVRPVEVGDSPLRDSADGHIALDVFGRQDIPAIVWYCQITGWEVNAQEILVFDGWGSVDICVKR